MSLKGKTLLITGASRGIGLAIARRAARDGANIAIAAKTEIPHPTLEGTIHSAAEAIEQAGGQALPLVVDVRDEAAVKGAIAQTVTRFGSLDIVVNSERDFADPGRPDRYEALRSDASDQCARHLHGLQVCDRAFGEGAKPAHPDAVPAARHGGKMVRAIYWLHDGQVRHEHGGAWARRRAAPQGHRRQRTVAPHHDRDRRDQEPARGRRHHAQVSHAGHTRRRRLSDIYEAGQELHRPVPDRRYVPRRRRRHRFRRLPRRSEPAVIAGFLRAGLKQTPAGCEFGGEGLMLARVAAQPLRWLRMCWDRRPYFDDRHPCPRIAPRTPHDLMQTGG